MTVAIDRRCPLGQAGSAAADQLLRQLERLDGRHRYVGLPVPAGSHATTLARAWWDQAAVPRLVRAAQADILYQPAGAVPLLRQFGVVAAVDTLAARLFPEEFPWDEQRYLGRWLPWSYRFADHLVVASEQTRRDVVELLGIPEERLTVVYGAPMLPAGPVPDPARLQRIRERYATGDRFILYAGSLAPRSNLAFLLRVFAAVRTKVRRAWTLVLAGERGRDADRLADLARDLGLAGATVFPGTVDQRDVPGLYAAASIAAVPVRYDGAGTSVFAALQAGLPTVASDASAVPEIVGKGGLLLPPTDLGAWTKALVALMTDASLRRDYGGRASRQARRFGWERTARETARVCERVWRERHGRS